MKRFLGVTLFLILVGAIFMGIGFVSGDSNHDLFFEDAQYEETVLVYEADEINDFLMYFSNRSVKFYPAEDDKVTIKYYESEHDWVEVELKNTQLELIQKSRWYFGINFGFWGINSSSVWLVEVYLPASVLTYDIDVDTSNGKIMMNGIEQLSRFNASSSNGEINIEGNLYITDELDLYTSNGKITLIDITADCDVKANTSNGKIIVTNITANDLYFDTSNGDIDVSVNGKYDDYRIEMDTSNGDCYINNQEKNDPVYNTSGTNLVRLSTSNGDVHLEFTIE